MWQYALQTLCLQLNSVFFLFLSDLELNLVCIVDNAIEPLGLICMREM